MSLRGAEGDEAISVLEGKDCFTEFIPSAVEGLAMTKLRHGGYVAVHRG